MNFIIKAYPYPYKVMFSFGEGTKKLLKKLDKEGVDYSKVKDSFSDEGYDGWFYHFPNKNTLLIRTLDIPTTPYQISVLSHEILHCVVHIMNSVGIPLSQESEEAYTYLQGYLIEQSLNKIK